MSFKDGKVFCETKLFDEQISTDPVKGAQVNKLLSSVYFIAENSEQTQKYRFNQVFRFLDRESLKQQLISVRDSFDKNDDSDKFLVEGQEVDLTPTVVNDPKATYFFERNKLVQLVKSYEIDQEVGIVKPPDSEREKQIADQLSIVQGLYDPAFYLS